MGFLILLFILPVVALVAQRQDFKRVIPIAVGFEAGKYLLLVLVSPIRSEFLSFLFSIIFFIAMLPEMMWGSESGPRTLWGWIPVLFAGVVWNIIPAYLISLLLPEKQARRIEA
jgi:hypothetical protein